MPKSIRKSTLRRGAAGRATVRTRAAGDARSSLRRRPIQHRGDTRLQAVLDAAELVIAEVGVEAATTNAIAARAGSGMGSLYRFFPNKQAIVDALAERYMAAMRPLTLYMERPQLATMPVARMVDAIVDPLIEFFRRSPAYRHVFHTTNQPGAPSRPCEAMKEAVVSHVDGLMAARAPKLPAAERRVHAEVAVELVHGMLGVAFEKPAHQRAPYLLEAKRLLALYAEMVQSGDDPLRRLR